MATRRIALTCPDNQREMLMALLSDAFDTFEELDTGFAAYQSATADEGSTTDLLNSLQERFTFSFQSEILPDQNWNAVWESNFQPIQVGDFCGIRADFHPPMPAVSHEIVINPRMAFGTGHHATTFGMIELMEGINFNDQKVLDYGCGTGILAILAYRLGARDLTAVEIEPIACENAAENFDRNEVPGVRLICGTLNDIIDEGYDLVLANINRNVILESLPTLNSMTESGGLLLISGFLTEDEDLMMRQVAENGFRVLHRKQSNNWLCLSLKKQKP